MGWRSGVVVSMVLSASSAQAYCRTHTLDPETNSCPAVCTEIGVPLEWRDDTIEYTFNERGFANVSDSELRRTFAAAFATWAQVDCGAENVGFVFTPSLQTTPLNEGPLREEPNENVILYYDTETWNERDHSPHAFAVTSVWHASNGTIIGADIMFNAGMGPFGVCSVQTCGTKQAVRSDLQNVATHEIGHLLGLAHSSVDGSTMACEASAGELLKRTLEADDQAGLCEAYPPGIAFAKPASEGGCALGSSSGWWMLALLLLLRQRVTPSTRKPSARSHSATFAG